MAIGRKIRPLVSSLAGGRQLVGQHRDDDAEATVNAGTISSHKTLLIDDAQNSLSWKIVP